MKQCPKCNSEWQDDFKICPICGVSLSEAEFTCSKCGKKLPLTFAFCPYCRTSRFSNGLEFESDGDGTRYVSGIGTCKDTDIRIPPVSPAMATVTGIGCEAFSHCASLTSVTIPDSVTWISDFAFNGCRSLTSITIPDSVTSIGWDPFVGCSSLTYNDYNGGKYLGNSENPYVVLMKGTATSGIHEDTKFIYEDAFRDCYSLTSITIPDSVTSIGNSAFKGCRSLTSITIPDSVVSIGWAGGVLSGCSSLQSITIPFVGNEAVVTSSDTHQHSFGHIFGTDSYTGGTATEQYYCISSTISSTYYIPASLKSVTVTGGYIPYGAFYNCSGLTSVTIGDRVTSIGERVFYKCSSLTSITVAEGNPIYHSAGNCIIKTASKTLIAGCKASVIPTDGSVTSIGEMAFCGCSSLTSITIPESVTSIGGSAFAWCDSLTSITIPEGVTSIGEEAFEGCHFLTSVTIPDSVTSIGGSAFTWCDSLTYNNYNRGKYLGNSENPYVVLIKGTATSGIHENTKFIYGCAFSCCRSLTSITIPDSVTSIGKCAFSGCRSLTRIKFKGTEAQWNAIEKEDGWDQDTGSYTIYCTNGKIEK